MKKIETLSDTVFEENLKEILSSGPEKITDHGLPTIDIRPRLRFPESYDTKKRNIFLSEVFIRVTATIAALALLAYFISNVYSKFR